MWARWCSDLRWVSELSLCKLMKWETSPSSALLSPPCPLPHKYALALQSWLLPPGSGALSPLDREEACIQPHYFPPHLEGREICKYLPKEQNLNYGISDFLGVESLGRMLSMGITSVIYTGFKRYLFQTLCFYFPSGVLARYLLSQRSCKYVSRNLKTLVHSVQILVTKVGEESSCTNPTHLFWTFAPAAIVFWACEIPQAMQSQMESSCVWTGFCFQPKGLVIRCFSLFKPQQFLGHLSPHNTPLIHLQHWPPK